MKDIDVLNEKLRDICNYNVVPQYKKEEKFLFYTKNIFWFKEENWWNVLCSVMDSIKDTKMVIDEYRNKWLWWSLGEKLIKLYWLLNAVYCQKESINNLYLILNQDAEINNNINILELRRIVTHISNANHWEAYFIVYNRLSDDFIELMEHTNKSNIKSYDLKETLVEYENMIYEKYQNIIDIIIENLQKKWIVIN